MSKIFLSRTVLYVAGDPMDETALFEICKGREGTSDFDTLGYAYDEPDALCFAASQDLLAALEDLLGDRPDVQGGICQHCGRDYLRSGHDDMLTGDCPADDCPAYLARSAIAKARGQQ